MEAAEQKQSSAMLALTEQKRKVECEHESFAAKMTEEMVARDAQLGKALADLETLRAQLEAEGASAEDALTEARQKLAAAEAREKGLERDLVDLRRRLAEEGHNANESLEAERRALAQKVGSYERSGQDGLV